ncbi:hypothetical protein [Variovorax sp. JS1663]|uniref:hypothetical protein n=1 Tax=Variovorax sp. JS1663 TaxID=1851577 RepID=UPI000B348081|nr:hypothetical protein [Variovorax sp. JS1663]OUL98457.1 hypothetical protein A8M77_31405 [Variovorax sp. JS1663]
MNSVTAVLQPRHSGFQPLDTGIPEEAGIGVFFSRSIRQTASWSTCTWQKLPRLTRIVLTGLLMTSTSFGLSMIVCVLTR